MTSNGALCGHLLSGEAIALDVAQVAAKGEVFVQFWLRPGVVAVALGMGRSVRQSRYRADRRFL